MKLFKIELTPPLRAISAFALMLVLAAPAANADESDYKILDWIESTSGGNQYIDTGIVGQSGLYVEAKLQWKALAQNATLLGSREDAGSKRYFCPAILLNTQFRFSAQYPGGPVNLSPYLSAEGQGVDIDYTFRSKILDGRQTASYTNHVHGTVAESYKTVETVPSIGLNLYVFASNRGDVKKEDYAVARLYYMKIFTGATADSDGTMVRDFVPVRRKSDDAIGLYDRVTGAFFENKSSTPFEYEEKGARVNVAVSPSLFGTVTPEEGELVAEATEMTYTLSDATLFDDGVTGYWDASRAWRAEFDKAVYTPLDGTAEDIAETNFTRSIGTGASVVWNFKNVKCRVGAEAVGAGRVTVDGHEGFKWLELGRTVTVKAIPALGARFVGWMGYMGDVTNAYAPSISLTVDGARTLTARFAKVPSKYEALDYIESTPDGNQYIDTGIIGRSGLYVEMRMMWVRAGGAVTVMGSYQKDLAYCCPNETSNSDARWLIRYAKSSVTAPTYLLKNIGTVGDKIYANNTPEGTGVVYTVKTRLVPDCQTLEALNHDTGVTAISVKGEVSGESDTDLPMFLFGQNRSDKSGVYQPAVVRIYTTDVYTNATATTKGILARQFVPVRVKRGAREGEIGLYDCVSGQFFENKNASAPPFRYGELPPSDYAPGFSVLVR